MLNCYRASGCAPYYYAVCGEYLQPITESFIQMNAACFQVLINRCAPVLGEITERFLKFATTFSMFDIFWWNNINMGRVVLLEASFVIVFCMPVAGAFSETQETPTSHSTLYLSDSNKTQSQPTPDPSVPISTKANDTASVGMILYISLCLVVRL